MIDGVALMPGRASGATLVLDEPLSFWGGVDATTGAIVDTHHPQLGASIGGRVLVMPNGRGSSSSSSVLAEVIRNGVGPAAIVLGTLDPILVLGALVARELYGASVPIVLLDETAYGVCASAKRVSITAGGDRAEIEALA
jgi:predicted aconitase with swiveling domain